jgi:hypothetical protein
LAVAAGPVKELVEAVSISHTGSDAAPVGREMVSHPSPAKASIDLQDSLTAAGVEVTQTKTTCTVRGQLPD